MGTGEGSRREHERFRLAFEHAPIGMALVSPMGRFTKVNAAMCRITGYSEGQLLARTTRDVTHPDDLADMAIRVEKLLTGVIDQYQAEKRFVRPDGTIVVAIVLRSLLRDSDGKPEQLLTHVVDITEKKRMEHELARSNADLANFAYLAAHDLKSPLQAITGFAAMLRDIHDTQLDDRGRECVGWILDGAGRMNALIDALLVFCRMSTGEADIVEVDLNKVLVDLLREIDPCSNGNVIADPLPAVTGDPIQFHELFLNLVSNALKFVAKDVVPRVHVSAEKKPGIWQVAVSDNGIGIAPELRERIFEMFGRLHTRERYPGTGIGLAICKRIVERRGGAIWVEDDPDGGSRFCFSIPDEVPQP